MKLKYFLAVMFVSFCQQAMAQATDGNRACQVLKAEDLSPWGYRGPLFLEDQAATVRREETKAPGDVLFENCALHCQSASHKGVVFVTLETVAGNPDPRAVAAWIKSSKDGQPPEPKAVTTLVDGVNCVISEYVIPQEKGEILQHYVACDKQYGNRHLVVSIQHPNASELPSPAAAKSLLDLAAQRLGKMR